MTHCNYRLKLYGCEAIFGCSFSHMVCHKDAKFNKHGNIMIMEDDATFKEKDQQIIQEINKFIPIEQFDVLYLGHSITSIKTIPNYQKIVKIDGTSLAHCYIVSKIHLDILSSFLYKPATSHFPGIDYFLSRNGTKYNYFSVHPSLVYQRTSYSDILWHVTSRFV